MTIELELHARRTARGLTQAQLAERAGVSRALVSAIESGRHLPRVDAGLALAAALGTTAEELFAGADRRQDRGLVDALSGEPCALGAPVRVGVVGGRLVAATSRPVDRGFEPVDAIAGESDLAELERGGPGVVVAGCEPSLELLERTLRDRGTRALAIGASSAAALDALRAGRLHAAAVHFREGASPPAGDLRVERVHLARWQVGLAAPRGTKRAWWRSALGGRVAVVQREPGAASQLAFEQAARPRARPIAGPRASSHLAAVRHALASGLPAVTIEPAAAAAGAAFHPLETHVVELWVSAERAADVGVGQLLETLGSARFRRSLESVGAYDLSGLGSRVRPAAGARA
jgi:transcriptional regulator with XRE-family HTH domain/molybdate-binding protein